MFVLVLTLGCKLNQLESESYTSAFKNAGFSIINSLAETSPSIIIINTCTVTSKADQKARRVIRKTLKDYPDSCVIVTGCYAQLDKTDLLKLDKSGRLFVFNGKESILKLPDYFNENLVATKDIFQILKTIHEQKNIEQRKDVFQFSPECFSSHTRSFLKIQDGCDKNCTYCRVRLARGPSLSLASDLVLERLRVLEKNYAEAVLTGVNICQYRDTFGKMTANNLSGLLKYLIDGTSKISLRLSSLEPDSVDIEFINVLSNKRIRPHFHLSIQSGSENVLKKMNRFYNSETVDSAVNLLRRSKDDPFLACDIITGFPGETESEFEETFEMCKKIGFAWIHVFPYSKRSGTAACSFKDSVNDKEITRRAHLLTDLAWKGRAEYVQRWLNREVDVLIEKRNVEKSFCSGVSENYLKLLVVHNWEKAPVPGTILHCKIIEINKENHKDYDAIAETFYDIP
jgi:threonylcarbamoyladenosine tRNA methylthiotransferase MtaB